MRVGRAGRAYAMSDVAVKWGADVAERGFTQIPNYLLLLDQFLDKEHRLSPVELLVLFQLAGAWWKPKEMPFPAMTTLAVRCGVSERQIQRAVTRLEKIGLIRRVKRRNGSIIASNAYDLAPLARFLNEVAQSFPTEFPRRVDRQLVKDISQKLNNISSTDGSSSSIKEVDFGDTIIGVDDPDATSGGR